jgi:hypothetical protein
VRPTTSHGWISLNMQTFHIIIHYVSCHHPLYAMSSSTKSHIYVFNRFSVAYSMYITPRVYKRILPCNIFGVTTFTFHFKILFKKFSQQRAGYHLVRINMWWASSLHQEDLNDFKRSQGLTRVINQTILLACAIINQLINFRQ